MPLYTQYLIILSETSTTERSLKDLYIEGIQSINFWNFLSLYCVGLRDISQRDISQRDISQRDIPQRDISRDISQRDISQRDISQRDISQQSMLLELQFKL